MKTHHHGSFRDPSGYLVREGGILYREITDIYRKNYEALMGSGLYDFLVGKGMMVSHTEANPQYNVASNHYLTIKPFEIPFISYPYEWSFSQLKDAALLTLTIQKTSLEHNMTLKDASAYNVQFHEGCPIFIDTLSFERYPEGFPWVGYRQFCQNFLAPLALMSKCDFRFMHLFRAYIDGFPLDLASGLLPKRTWLSFPILLHIHLHAKSQKKYADTKRLPSSTKQISKKNLLGFIDSLERCVKKLTWKLGATEWGDYYSDTNYSDASFEEKKSIVESFVKQAGPATIWDLGSNTGEFSRIAAKNGEKVISFDIDPVAVEKNYLQVKAKGEKNILPLIQDLTNPSPGIGWMHKERESLMERGPVDMCLALALIHHLAISNNVPLSEIARFFSSITSSLVIEFVPKQDSQVERLLATRKDIFDNYNREGFEEAFKKYFMIEQAAPIKNSERILYLMRQK